MLINGIFRWMDGSLFFRGLTAFMDFLKRIAMGSFIVGLFVGEEGHRPGFFAWLADKIFNPLSKSSILEDRLPSFISGSWLLCALVSSLGMVLVVLAAPVLPTMVVAGLIVPVFLITILSRKFEITPMMIALLLFIAVNFFAGFTSATPGASIQIAVLVSLFMLAAIIIPAVCRTGEHVDLLFLAFLAGAGLTGLVGLYQVVAGYMGQVYLDVDVFADIRFRVVSTLGNPNVFGMYLVLAIPLAAVCVFYLKHPFLKLCSAGLTGLLLINLLLTYSRGSYLALGIAVGIFVLIMEKRLVVLFIPAVMALPFVLPTTVLNRLLSIVDFSDTSAIFRTSIWQGSVRILRNFWMSGIGQGAEAFNSVFPYYAPAATVAEHSHNLIIQVMLELGIVGLLVFLAVLACYFKVMANFLRRATELRLRLMAAAMVAAVIGFLFQGIFDHVFHNFRVLLAFYIFLGLGVAFSTANMPKKAKTTSRSQNPPIIVGYK